ncbi:helix-turn-helix domain-containing protein [Desulfurispora thermophila]|uniref:helix-turn-helix domain-containing protein n=1 Tax=Desulfurispora thermophila TaxID=265470 RepID=UPI0005240F89|nr:helix-turn-helix transcriptional regulator [Desulfurispora thermophila]
MRFGKGISAKRLAEILGVSKAMVSHYESGRYKPSAKVIIRLERFFGIPAGELLAESDAEEDYRRLGSSERPTR